VGRRFDPDRAYSLKSSYNLWGDVEVTEENLHRREPFRLISSLKRWRANPIGLIARGIEFLAFGQPLHTLLRTGIFPEDRAQDYVIESFSNAIVSVRSGILKTSAGRVVAPFLADRYFMSGNFYDDIFQLVRKKPNAMQFTGEYFVIPRQDYYFHFITDWVPRILLLAKARPQVRYLIADNPKYVHQFFESQNLVTQVVKKKTVRVQKVIVLESTLNLVDKVKLIRNALITNEIVGNQRIFVSRKGYTRHDVASENRIIKEHINGDIPVVDPGQLSLNQQVTFFQSVGELHAVHGGGLTNLIFMSPGSKVTEYFTSPYRHYCFRELAAAGSLEYREEAI
jgi:capsular polysaccharide biosynthesis protein